MNELEFCFDTPQWESLLAAAKPGDKLPASAFLAATEEESESRTRELLNELTEKGIAVDIQSLPGIPIEGSTGDRLRREETLAKSADMMSDLPEGDPLRVYLQEINMQSGWGSEDAFSRLLPRVVSCAGKFTGRGVLLSDLIQEGNLGLMQAMQEDPEITDEKRALWWIEQYMICAVVLQAKLSGVGQKMRKAMEDYTQMDEKLLTQIGRNPTVEEIAESMHMTPSETEMVAEAVSAARLLQTVRAIANEEQSDQDAAEAEVPIEDTAYFQMRRRIRDLLSCLDEEEAELLTLRYGLEGGTPASAQTVANMLNISPDEVTKREAAALEKIRREQ